MAYKYTFNALTGRFDVIQDVSIFLQLDCSNDPLTGDLELYKSEPVLTLKDNSNDYTSTITKKDTSTVMAATQRTDGGNTDDCTMLLTFDSDSWTDSSTGAGTANTFSESGSPSTTSGKFSNAIDFTGGSKYIYTSNAASNYNFGSGEFSVDFWYKRSTTGLERVMGNLASGGTETDCNFYFYFNSDTPKCRLPETSGGRLEVESATDITDTSWHHYVVCRDGDTIRLYVDGEQKATDDATDKTLKTPTFWYIGVNGAYTSNSATGEADELRIMTGTCPDEYRGGVGFSVPTSAYSGYSYSTKNIYGNTFSDGNYFGNSDVTTTLKGSNIPIEIGGSDIGVINAAGNMGLGTTTPSARIQIDGDDTLATGLRIDNIAESGICIDLSECGGDTLATYPFTILKVNNNCYIDRLSSGNTRYECKFDVLTANSYIQALIFQNTTSSDHMYFDLINNSYGIKYRNSADTELISITNNSGNGSLNLLNDNGKITFGAAADAEIYYDGTNLVVNTDATGTGGFNINSLIVDKDGFLQPVSSADASAPNNSIYYSTTASKLVYKDSGGTVNNLY